MMHAELSRKALPKDTLETREARKDHIKALKSDPRFKSLRRSDKLHIQLLLQWHDPLTGYLPYTTPALNLTDRLFMSEEDLRLSRWRLIDVGLIVSYVPGSGRVASRYCVARSWNEADKAAALRQLPDAPHWPALVDDTPSAVDCRGVPAAAVDEDQEQEETEQERADAEERLHRARLRRGIRGPVPPVLPDAGELDAIRERAERETDLDQRNDTIVRGVALARAEIKRGSLSTASGAA
jgi:hypothetical protein